MSVKKKDNFHKPSRPSARHPALLTERPKEEDSFWGFDPDLSCLKSPTARFETSEYMERRVIDNRLTFQGRAGVIGTPIKSQIAGSGDVHGNSPQRGEALITSMRPEEKRFGATRNPSPQSNWTAHELAALFIKIELRP